MALLLIMRLIMENRDSVVPYMCAVIGVMQVMTIAFILGIPTHKVEMVCQGIYDTPNAVRCYEQ